MTKINGFPIVRRERVDRTRDGRQGYLVIVDRGEAERQRYVVSLWFDGDKEWCQGHYRSTLERAKETFAELIDHYHFVGGDEEAASLTIFLKGEAQ